MATARSSAPGGGRRSRLRNHMLENIDDLLAGTRFARITVGIIAVSAALLVGSMAIFDAVERHQRAKENPYKDKPGTHLSQNESDAAKTSTAAETAKLQHEDLHNRLNDMDKDETLVDDAERGLLQIKHYRSDNCLWVYRKKGKDYSTKFVPSELDGTSLAVALLDEPKFSSNDSSDPPLPPRLESSESTRLVPALFQSELKPKLIPVQGGRCLNPHPGPFNWWWGQPTGCWVPMFRQFADGCQHYQMFNSCGNFYDSQIHWTQCRH